MFAKTSSENIRNSTEKTEISNDKQMLFNLLSNHPVIYFHTFFFSLTKIFF